MECIVQDFPFGNGPIDSPVNASTLKTQESNNRLLDDSIPFDKTQQVENTDQDV